jgi:hypothetical protein
MPKIATQIVTSATMTSTVSSDPRETFGASALPGAAPWPPAFAGGAE